MLALPHTQHRNRTHKLCGKAHKRSVAAHKLQRSESCLFFVCSATAASVRATTRTKDNAPLAGSGRLCSKQARDESPVLSR